MLDANRCETLVVIVIVIVISRIVPSESISRVRWSDGRSSEVCRVCFFFLLQTANARKLPSLLKSSIETFVVHAYARAREVISHAHQRVSTSRTFERAGLFGVYFRARAKRRLSASSFLSLQSRRGARVLAFEFAFKSSVLNLSKRALHVLVHLA